MVRSAVLSRMPDPSPHTMLARDSSGALHSNPASGRTILDLLGPQPTRGGIIMGGTARDPREKCH